MKKLKQSTENQEVSIFPNYLLGIILTSKLGKVLNIEYPPMFCEYWNNSNRWANDIEAANKNAKKLLLRIKKDDKFVEEIINKFYSSGQNLSKISSEIKKLTLNKYSSKRLAELFKTFIRLYLDALIYGWLPIGCEGFTAEFSDLLKGFLSKKLKGNEELVNRYFIYLTTPKKKSKRQQAEKMIIDFLKRKKPQKNINEFIKRYLEKYQWLNYNYQGPVLTKKDVLAQIKEIKNRKEKKEKTRFDINFIKNDILYSRLFSIAREFMYMKNKRQETLFYSHFCLDKLLSEISERLRMTLKKIKSMTVEEIKLGLEKNKVNRKKIRSRSKHSIFVFVKDKVEIIVGEEKIKNFLNKYLIKEKVEKVYQIKGQVAYMGKIRGIVKVINSIEKMGKMRKDNVLVSSKTNPNFMIAIKKASAIVTDYGGITCHAAIVSRELKKPCIIGTKIATKVLKDGMMVEVDANRGVVKILKNKNS